MRYPERLALAAVLAAACAIPLEEPPPVPVPLPVKTGCALLGGAPPLAEARSIQAEARRLWLGIPPHDPTVAFLGEQEDGCVAASWTPLALRPPWPGASVQLGDAVMVGEELWYFYTASEADPGASFGQRIAGHGVGRREGSELVPQGGLLWAGDAPPLGRGAVEHEGTVYAYGCLAVPGEFRSVCYAARAPVEHLDRADAWRYSQGSGRWGQEQEQALALVEANDGPSIRRVGAQFVMAYAPVLGGEVVVRTARTPDGPWSRPEPLFRCALPGDGWFCGGVGLHPRSGGALEFSYAPRRLDPPAGGPARLVAASLPAGLP